MAIERRSFSREFRLEAVARRILRLWVSMNSVLFERILIRIVRARSRPG